MTDNAADQSLAELITSRAVALPAPDDPEFAAVFDCYANKRVVMLGEGSHGTHEFYAACATITRQFMERTASRSSRRRPNGRTRPATIATSPASLRRMPRSPPFSGSRTGCGATR